MAAEEKIVGVLSQMSSALTSNSLDLLSAKDFRVFIDSTRQQNDISKEVLQEASNQLLVVLSKCHFSNDTQIVIATAYSSVVTSLLQNANDIFDHFVQLLTRKRKEIEPYICYAVLQLNNALWTTPSNSKEVLLQEIFRVIKESVNDLKSTTYLVFKVLSNFLQKIHLNYPSGQGCPEEWFEHILIITLANWENPLTGIRQINSLIFNQLLDFEEHFWQKSIGSKEPLDNNLIKHERLLDLVFKQLSWAVKSKFFLLSEIVSKSSISQIMDLYSIELVNGLLTSLSVPHLVSAGADLYCKVLANLSLREWQEHFLPVFTNVMTKKDISLELENIFNYWVPHTIKKLPVIEALFEVTELNLYSFINLHRIARKESFHCSLWETIDKVKLKLALQDFNDKIRSQAFSLVCVSSKTLSPPVEEELVLVKDFLRHNVSSDNTALRQNLLNSFTNLVVRIRDSLLTAVKNNQFGDSSSSECVSLLDWLHSFLLFNLQEGCNYQRKITSLEMYKIVLIYFGEPIKETSQSHKRKSNKNHLTLKDSPLCSFNYSSEDSRRTLQKCLFDEDNEIRSCAALILMNHFKIADSHQEEFENLIETGWNLSLSEIFYKAEGGALIVQVLVALAYNSSSNNLKNIIYKGGNNYVSVLLSSCEDQFEKLQKDLLKAAVERSFLYGTLQALNLLLTDPNSPEFMALDKIQLERLLVLMEDVTKHFIAVLSTKSDQRSDFAPSFGEMGMAIKEIVDKSSLTSLAATDEVSVDEGSTDLQLTPAQQLVLSCVWLNIKECTNLCSRLVAKPLTPEDVKRCVHLVVFVLRKCRHKGAIESAGLALYQITQHVTSSKNEELLKLPNELMDEFLESLTGNTATTISRRSAGLAILVHKLITGDKRPKKPLLHSCVYKLLSVASNPDIGDKENLVDLPQSQALHFLRTLVQESSLKEHMAQYTLAISLLAVNNLASSLWTIRNAALQLFGALVPKLVGQKPHQEESTGHHFLPFEELYARAKPLVDMMLTELTSAAKENSSTLHSKLMPLLTLVTNLCVGLQTFVSDDVQNTVHQFRTLFEHFFSSDIYNVRKLSAKAHSLFLTTAEIVPYICKRREDLVSMIGGGKVKQQSENKVHGYLLNVVQLYNRFNEEKVGMKVLLVEEEKVKTKLKLLSELILSSKCSHFVKSLIFQLDYVGNCLVLENIKRLDPGFSHFTNQLIFNLVFYSPGNELKEKLHVCLIDNSSIESKVACLKALKLKTASKTFCKTDKDSLNHLLKLLSDVAYVCSTDIFLLGLTTQIILNILELLASKEPPAIEYSCPQFISKSMDILVLTQNSTLALPSLLPVVCGLITTENTKDLRLVEKLAEEIQMRSNPRFNQDVRVHAAKALFFLTPSLKINGIKETKIGELVWMTAITFLQDEVNEVRYESSKFVTHMFLGTNESRSPLNPAISLDTLFEFSSMIQIMNTETAVKCLWRQLMCSSIRSQSQGEIVNPFNHDTGSIYAEDHVVSHRAFTCLCELLRSVGSSEAKEIGCIVKQNCDEILVNKLTISSKIMDFVEELKLLCK